MKNSIFFLFLSSLLCSVQIIAQKTNSIEGVWMLGFIMEEKTPVKLEFTFKASGEFISEDSRGTQQGTYTQSEDGKILTLKYEHAKRGQVEEQMGIERINEKELIITAGTSSKYKYTFFTAGWNPMKGLWTLESIDDRNVSSYFNVNFISFKSNGAFIWMNEGERKKGTYIKSEDGEILTLKYKDKKDLLIETQMEIEHINKTTLILTGGSDKKVKYKFIEKVPQTSETEEIPEAKAPKRSDIKEMHKSELLEKSPVKCGYCGSKNLNDSEKCTNCGAPLH